MTGNTHPLLTSAVAELFERAVANLLAADPHGKERLGELAGRVIAIHLRPFDSEWYLCPGDRSIQLLGEFSGQPDVTISGTLSAFARLALTHGDTGSLFGGGVEIEGDTHVAKQFQALLQKLNIDWEGWLAPYFGASLATSGVDLIRSSLAWGHESLETLKLDLAEFWQEESRDLPSAYEANAFYTEVDRLRSDYDRLEARLRRLENSLSAPATEHPQ